MGYRCCYGLQMDWWSEADQQKNPSPCSRLQCAIEDKLTLEKVDGREVEKYETKVTTEDGHVTKYLKDVPNS